MTDEPQDVPRQPGVPTPEEIEMARPKFAPSEYCLRHGRPVRMAETIELRRHPVTRQEVEVVTARWCGTCADPQKGPDWQEPQ